MHTFIPYCLPAERNYSEAAKRPFVIRISEICIFMHWKPHNLNEWQFFKTRSFLFLVKIYARKTRT